MAHTMGGTLKHGSAILVQKYELESQPIVIIGHATSPMLHGFANPHL